MVPIITSINYDSCLVSQVLTITIEIITVTSITSDNQHLINTALRVLNITGPDCQWYQPSLLPIITGPNVQ